MRSRNTRRHFKEIVIAYKPGIFAIFETRVHSSTTVDLLENVGFTDLYAVEAVGYAGEIWLMWNCNMAIVEILYVNDQAVKALVTKLEGQIWLLTVVYASPRYQLWTEL